MNTNGLDLAVRSRAGGQERLRAPRAGEPPWRHVVAVVADLGLWPAAVRRAAGNSTARRRRVGALPRPLWSARREGVTG